MRQLLLSASFAFVISLSVASAQSAFQMLLPSYTPASKRAVVQTPDGGFCILASDSAANLVLIKVLPDGKVEWGRRFPLEPTQVHPKVLRRTDDGGFLAFGRTDECGIDVENGFDEENGLNERNGFDEWNERDGECNDPNIFLIRFDAHGYPLWGKVFEGAIPTDVATNDVGEIALVGLLEITDEEGQAYNSFALFLDREGAVQWGRLFNGTYINDYDTDDGDGAVCVKNSGEITTIFDFNVHTDSLDGYVAEVGAVVNLTRDGEVKRAQQVNERRVNDEDTYRCRSLLLEDIIPRPDGGYSMAASMWVSNGGECAVSSAYSLTVACDAAGEALWHNINGLCWEGASSSILPFGDRGAIVASSGYYDAYQVIVNLFDDNGKSLEQKGLRTSGWGGYEGEISDEGLAMIYDGNVSYALAEDGGIVLVGAAEEEGDGDVSGLLIHRLAPDISACGGNMAAIQKEERENYEYSDEDDADAEMSVQIVGALDESETDEEEYLEEEDDLFPLLPLLSDIDVGAVPIELSVRAIPNIRVEELEIPAQELCRQKMAGTASASSSDTDVTLCELTVVPNSVRKGGIIDIDVTMAGGDKPRITLVNVATGETVRIIDPTGIAWSSSEGFGSTRLFTDNITSGTYLIRAQSGELQCTAKIEVH